MDRILRLGAGGLPGVGQVILRVFELCFVAIKQRDCSQIVNMLTVYKFEKNLSRIEKSSQIEKCMSTNFNIT